MGRPILWVGAAIAAVLFLLSAVTGVFWLGDRATAAALDGHGVTTMATVEAKRTDTRRVRSRNGMRRETDYLVTYAFEARSAGGTETTQQLVEHEVPQSIYDDLRSGQEVEIRYLPDDPSRADFYRGESRGTSRVMGWATAILLTSAGAALSLAFVISRKGQQDCPDQGPAQSA